MDTEENQLIKKIESAFAGVKLGGGISLNMTEYHDSGGCAPHFKKLALMDERDDWKSIPDKVLEKFIVTFCFTDIEGFRFYIPAYMIWTLKNHATNHSIIGDSAIYAIDTKNTLFKKNPISSVFTKDQVACMIEFLEYCVSHDDTCDGTIAKMNLEKLRAEQSKTA